MNRYAIVLGFLLMIGMAVFFLLYMLMLALLFNLGLDLGYWLFDISGGTL